MKSGMYKGVRIRTGHGVRARIHFYVNISNIGKTQSNLIKNGMYKGVRLRTGHGVRTRTGYGVRIRTDPVFAQ